MRADGQTTIVLTNPSGTTCKLPQGTCVGLLTAAEAIDPVSREKEDCYSTTPEHLEDQAQPASRVGLHRVLRNTRDYRKLLQKLVLVYHGKIKPNCFHFCVIITIYLLWMKEREVSDEH